jgi:hypothetical protein
MPAPAATGKGNVISKQWDDATQAVRFTVVKLSATNSKGNVGMSGATTERPYGVVLNAPTQGSAASVQIDGKCYVVSDGTTPIAAGDELVVDSTGRVIKFARPAAWDGTAYYTIGIAESGSAAANVLIEMTIHPLAWG